MRVTCNNILKEFKVHNHNEQRDVAALPIRAKMPNVTGRGPRRHYIWLAEETAA